VTRLRWRWIGFCLALAALAACGIKGDPVPPKPGPEAETAAS
jgi:predicted small lipoprotein YifL